MSKKETKTQSEFLPIPTLYSVEGLAYTIKNEGAITKRLATTLLEPATLKLVEEDLKKIGYTNPNEIRIECRHSQMKQEKFNLMIEAESEDEVRQKIPIPFLIRATYLINGSINLRKIEIGKITKRSEKQILKSYYSDVTNTCRPGGEYTAHPKVLTLNVTTDAWGDSEISTTPRRIAVEDAFTEYYDARSSLSLDEINIQLSLGVPPHSMLDGIKFARNEKKYALYKQLAVDVAKRQCPVCKKKFTHDYVCKSHGVFKY